MIEQIAENRGYDRGFTAGTKHAHELISHYAEWVKQLRSVIEVEHGHVVTDSEMMKYQHQATALEHAKLTIRKGYWDENSRMPY